MYSTRSVTLVAVRGVAGMIRGNGQVYLVNPNGIAITPTGVVRVDGGFVASTLDLTADGFMAASARSRAAAPPRR